MYRKILVPYDGSKPSEHALEQAMGLAKLIKNQVWIIFLYIVQEVPVPVMIERPVRSPKTGEVTTVSKLIKELMKR